MCHPVRTLTNSVCLVHRGIAFHIGQQRREQRGNPAMKSDDSDVPFYAIATDRYVMA